MKLLDDLRFENHKNDINDMHDKLFKGTYSSIPTSPVVDDSSEDKQEEDCCFDIVQEMKDDFYENPVLITSALQRQRSEADDFVVPTFSKRGLKLSFLDEFLAKADFRFEGKTTGEVCNGLVMRDTLCDRVSYCDWLQATGPAAVL